MLSIRCFDTLSTSEVGLLHYSQPMPGRGESQQQSQNYPAVYDSECAKLEHSSIGRAWMKLEGAIRPDVAQPQDVNAVILVA